MYVFRIHIRPQGGIASMKETFDYCLENQILGVGWQVDSTNNPDSWEEYLREAEEIHGNLNVCKYIKKWVSEGDLVWTRSDEGKYFLAKVQSGWEYWISESAVKRDIDLANIFRVKLFPVESDAVPGKVVACFRAPRTIQEIASKPAIEYSKYLWNTLSKTNDYEIDQGHASDIFEMLDDEETEDLVFMYLQYMGWVLIPNSRKKDTMNYEFLAVNPKTGERAVSQVKTGNSEINIENFSSYKEKVFLFQSNELYAGIKSENAVFLSRKEILEFIGQAKDWLPSTIQNKINLVKLISSTNSA